MDQTVMKIALAGLMHDMGKFAQGALRITPEYRTNNADLYQPFRDGHHTHQHALYTAAFIEQLADHLPEELNSSSWGDGDIFINLAAGHHRPESPLQWILTKADWISSGLDRSSFEEGEAIKVREYKKTRLLTLFEQLDLEGVSGQKRLDDFKWCYPLEYLSAQSIFPSKVDGEMTKEKAETEYHKLFEQFLDWLPKLENRTDNLELWMQHFDSLLQTFTAMIPAARVGSVIPDVSLYDHAKTTAALASALYLYHRDTDSLIEEAVRADKDEKFLLVSADFYGIQSYIFSPSGESAAYRSKLLRGRSFTVSLFSELAADMLCQKLGLTSVSVVLNAAGKFTAIVQNTEQARKSIIEVSERINEWLYSISYGQSSMGFTMTTAAPADFYSTAFGDLWERHKEDMEQTKATRLDLARFGGVVDHYLDQFDNTLQPPLCPFCNTRPSEIDAGKESYLGDDGAACKMCRDHIMLGTHLVKAERIRVIRGAVDLPLQKKLAEPLFGEYQLTFADEGDVKNVARIWNPTVSKDGSLLSPVTARLINGYVPVYEESDLADERMVSEKRREEDREFLRQGVGDGRPMTFGDIACLALSVAGEAQKNTIGTPALGVLKADVDNLGLLMACGLPEDRYTLSRMATLSRQLDSFFTVYLPHLLQNDERYRSVYTVFAGGDDLFLIGPWNRMAELALLLRDKFCMFVAENAQLHFSAGVTMHKPHAPVDSLARQAEHSLEEAKDRGRNRVTVFNETVTWDELQSLVKCGEEMEKWRGNYLASSSFYRLNELVRMAGEEKKLDRDNVHISAMQCLRWRSQLKYLVARNLNKELKGESREQALDELDSLSTWLKRFGGAMKIPLWNILYNQR